MNLFHSKTVESSIRKKDLSVWEHRGVVLWHHLRSPTETSPACATLVRAMRGMREGFVTIASSLEVENHHSEGSRLLCCPGRSLI
jgi:hypothetical protein